MAFALILGYFLGSIPIGVLVGSRLGKDLRSAGSGNIGATNALRVLGKGPAALVLVGDVLKGVLATLIGAHFAGIPGAAAGGLFAVIGHAWPVWLRFRGGKAAATTLGFLLVLYPAGFGIGIAVFVVMLVFLRFVSLGSMVAALATSASLLVEKPPGAVTLAVLGCTVVLIARHRSNIDRLLRRQEPRLGR